MTLMNMMDSIFYLGLVATFLLILLVVYHFKNRVSTMEQRCDTMFEIMNNIVQELNLLRRQNTTSFGGGAPMNVPTNQVEHSHSVQMYPRHDDESDDEDEDEESGDDESSYLSEDDLEEDEEEDEERVVELDNELKQVKMVEDDVQQEPTQSSLLEIDDNNSIKVEKVETTLENTDQMEEFPSAMDAYKAMTNSALKALVIEKGLSTNPSKLKKVELIELLNELE